MTSESQPVDRPTARAIAQGSLMEGVWSIFGLLAVGFGLAGYEPRYMIPLASFAFGIALIARSGAMAARWPRADRREAVGIGGDLFGAAVCIGIGAVALLTPLPLVAASVPALLLGGLLISDGPIQTKLAGCTTQDDAIVRVMSVAGVSAIVLALVGVLSVDATLFVLMALACAGIGHLAASGLAYSRRVRGS
jgi:hypothetical protein